MDEDTGNPWLAIPKTYKGQYQALAGSGVTLDSDNVMLSSDNDVTFMGTASTSDYIAGDVLMIMPVECRPAVDIYLPCCISVDGTHQLSFVQIDTDGYVTLPDSFTNLVVELAGMTYNIGVNFYRGGE